MNQFVILSFGEDPLNWPSFIEIGEIACSTPAWCTHGLTLNVIHYLKQIEIYLSKAKYSIYEELSRGFSVAGFRFVEK